MPLPEHAGTYIARARQWAVEQREGKCPRWVVDFQLLQYWNGQEWAVIQEDLAITGYFTLINTDGSPNEINVQAIVDAYELPAIDFKILAEADFASMEVQLVLDHRTYTDSTGNEKTTMDVKYLNHRDYEGRKLKSDAGVVQSLNQKYGALLRTKFKPKTAQTKPATAASAAAKMLAKPAVAKTIKEAMNSAWSEFKLKTPELTQDARTAEWHKTVKEYGAPKEASQLTVDDWQILGNKIAEYGPWKEPPSQEAPVVVGVADDGPPITEDDLPF
jgi:hypothetical protein